MDIRTFITNYYEAFCKQAELPIAFWYSDQLEAETEKEMCIRDRIFSWVSFPNINPTIQK